MRHQDGGQPHGVVQLANQLGSGAQRNRIQPGKRFVVHHQFRVQRNRACQRHAPRHAARNLRRHQIARAAQAHGVQLHQHDVAHQRFGQIGVFAQWKGDVFKHIHVGEQRAVLKQHPHAPAGGVERGGVHLADVLAVKQHLALLGALLAANQAHHRGFAAARGAHDGRDFAARHRHRQATQHWTLAIAEVDVAQFDQRSRMGGRVGR